MQIALYGRSFDAAFFPVIHNMITLLESACEKFYIHEPFYSFLKTRVHFQSTVEGFKDHKDIPSSCFCMISIGGDGTLLDTMPFIRDSGIPVLGINTGRLGFLSSVSTDHMDASVRALLNRNFTLDQRSMLELETQNSNPFEQFPYALNELSLIKRDNTTMISISVYVDNFFLNTYWADGLMVATPTGSTGYSLSCGGPIISPDSENFIITPIASHNLTVRPVVIKDSSVVKLRAQGRVKNHLIVMDSRSIPMEEPVDLYIKKAGFQINLIQIEGNEFFKTIRNKLAWGLDKRN